MSRIDEKLIVGIDPSSTATGIARLYEGEVVDLELVRPPVRRPALTRSAIMASRVADLLEAAECAPEASDRIRYVIVEVSTGKVHRRRQVPGAGAGLATYGTAVGMILWAARSAVGPGRVLTVTENVWTAGKPKGERLALLRIQFAAYREFESGGRDKGGDVGDALGLAAWLAGRLDTIERTDGALKVSDLEVHDLVI